MTDLFFNNFELSMLPESEPTWKVDTQVISNYSIGEIVNISFPISSKRSSENESGIIITEDYKQEISLNLLITNLNDNGSTTNISGVLYDFYKLFTPTCTTIITIHPDFLKNDDIVKIADSAKIIYGETLEDILVLFSSLIKIPIKISDSPCLKFPVISEADPIVILNGSYAEQLSSLLQRFSPTTLWGQKPSWWIIPFERSNIGKSIYISFPISNNAKTIYLDLIKPIDWRRQLALISRPEQIFLQEDVTAAFRTESHIVDGRLKREPFSYQTEHQFANTSDYIKATLDGYKTSQGGLVFDENWIATTKTVKEVIVEYPTPYGETTDPVFTTKTILTGSMTQVKTEVHNSYLIGPPYDVIIGSDELLNNPTHVSSEDFKTKYFNLSGRGSHRSLAMDYSGEILVDELCSSDGALLLQRKTKTEEVESILAGYLDEEGNEPVVGDEVKPTITETEETFAYNKETGKLVIDRIKTKKISSDDTYTIENTINFYKVVTEDLMASFTCSRTTSYDENGLQVSETVPDISVNVSSGDGSNTVNTKSSFGAALDNIEVEGPILFKKLYSINNDIETQGSIYISLPCLLIDEMSEYLDTNFVTDAKISEQIAFSTYFLDPIDLIGMNVNFKSEGIKIPYDIKYKDSVHTSIKQTYNISQTIERIVTGLVLSVDSNNVVLITISTCALANELQ